MNPIALYLRFRWVHVPLGVLLALLQRTPVVRLVISVEYVLRAQASVLLKSGLAAAAFGALHSRAGATTFSTNPATPASTTVGQSFTMVFGVTGTPTPAASYLFSSNIPPGLSVQNATASNPRLVNAFTATLSGTPTTAGTFNFTVSVTNGPNQTSTGTMPGAVSFSATIMVQQAQQLLAITEQPESATVAPGGSVTFSVTTTGSGTLTYQWSKDGATIAGATSRTFTRSNLSTADSGDYSVVVSSSAGGSVTSMPATLLVAAPMPGRLTNISVRSRVLTGDKVLVAGFVLGGGGSKPMLVRAIGPGLTEFGVAGVLANPQLEIAPLGSPPIAQNDNWGGAAELKTAFAQLGAFPLKDDASFDAASLATLPAMPLTATVTGVSGGTGVALAEVYDAGTGNTPKLVNLSARTEVGTGDNVLVAGFVFNGNMPKRLLVRAIGPELSRFGVSGVLADPVLSVHRAGGPMLAQNDNWGGSAALKQAFQSVGAFSLENDASKDAALLIVLMPGVYTAQVNGAGNTTGVALVEVYEVP